MDFVADQLANGTKFRVLTVVDVFTREALAIEVGQRLKGEDVVAMLDRVSADVKLNPQKWLSFRSAPTFQRLAAL